MQALYGRLLSALTERDRTNEKARMLIAVCAVCAPAAFLCGCDSLEDALADETLVRFTRDAALLEIAPALGIPPEEAGAFFERLAALARAPLGEALSGIVAQYRACVAPLLRGGQRLLPVALSALMMLLAGVRGRGEDYVVPHPRTGEPVALRGEEAALRAFSRYACDMAGESLAYAVLADQEVWGRDLRGTPELETRAAAALEEFRLLGARGALRRCLKGDGV